MPKRQIFKLLMSIVCDFFSKISRNLTCKKAHVSPITPQHNNVQFHVHLTVQTTSDKSVFQINNLSKDYHCNYKIFSYNNNSSNKLISSYFNKTKKDSRLIATKYIANDLINAMVKRKKPKYDLLKAFNVQKLINAFLVSKKHKREIKILK